MSSFDAAVRITLWLYEYTPSHIQNPVILYLVVEERMFKWFFYVSPAAHRGAKRIVLALVITIMRSCATTFQAQPALLGSGVSPMIMLPGWASVQTASFSKRLMLSIPIQSLRNVHVLPGCYSHPFAARSALPLCTFCPYLRNATLTSPSAFLG